jgi:hypothetical protein
MSFSLSTRSFARMSLAAGLTILCACHHSGSSSSQAAKSKPTASFPSDVAVAWLDLLYDSVRDSSFSPPVASRAIAYSGVALYESVVPGMPQHQSLGGQLNGLDPLPEIGAGVHHFPAVANAALAQILRHLFANAPAGVLQSIDALEAQLEAQYAGVVSQAVLDRSIERGLEVAAAISAWSLEDGFDVWNNCPYTIPTGLGFWVKTPPAFANPLQPCWGKVRPFVMLYAAECPSLPPTPYSEQPGSKFYLEAVEVRDTVDNLTQAQLDIAHFWADNPTQTGTPPGHWVRIVSQCAGQQAMKLDLAAEAYCRVGLATADAFISCWDMKYFYNLMRPITYIQDPNGLNAPAWNTPPAIGGVGTIPTPPFPEHTSGHSVQSGAAAEVLTDLLGNVPFVDDCHAALALAPRSFDNFFEAADEAAISRLYAGIHFRPAIERGVEQGRCIGNLVNTQVAFRK